MKRRFFPRIPCIVDGLIETNRRLANPSLSLTTEHPLPDHQSTFGMLISPIGIKSVRDPDPEQSLFRK
jgi:hypothetical protein